MRSNEMLFAFVCCAALAPIVFCGDVRPAISHISNDVTKDIGDEVQLNCTLQNAQGYKVLWFKVAKDRNDRIPVSVNNESVVGDDRFSVKVNQSTYSLRIERLQQSDTGAYQCQISISLDDRVSAEVGLQIRRAPMINRKNSTESAEVTAGTSVELHCYADGYPVPYIEWKREGDVLLSSGGAIFMGEKLMIEAANKDDRGTYYCRADNGIGKGDRHNVSVRILFRPEVTAVRPRVGQTPGYDIDLECKVEAYPAPKITWYKNGAELKKEEIKGSGDVYVSTLTRYSVASSDYGEYVCRAENNQGFDETRIDLFETIVPVCSPACG